MTALGQINLPEKNKKTDSLSTEVGGSFMNSGIIYLCT